MEARCVILACLILIGTGVHSQNLDSIYSSGREAYANGQFERAIDSFEAFEQVRRNYPPVMRYLAMLYSQTGQTEKSLRYLGDLSLIDADTSFLRRSEFDELRGMDEFSDIVNRFEYMLDSVRHSEHAFTLENKNIHPETLAYDRERSRFFIGSIRLRSIFVYESGRSYAFKTEAQDSLLAVTGMAVNQDDGLLWVASANLPQMKRKAGAADGSFVHVYDIASGVLIRRFHLSGNILIGDLTIGREGAVYLTDSRSPDIYRATIDSVAVWKNLPRLRNLQGITGDGSGNLYISDYIHGLFRISEEGAKRLEHPATVSVKGIDGLYYKKGNLLAMQNGVFPMRVTQYSLDDTGGEIVGVAYLDKNLRGLNEPVQGVWVGDWFYFIANSPWRYYDENFSLSEDVPRPEVWRTNLVR